MATQTFIISLLSKYSKGKWLDIHALEFSLIQFGITLGT